MGTGMREGGPLCPPHRKAALKPAGTEARPPLAVPDPCTPALPAKFKPPNNLEENPH